VGNHLGRKSNREKGALEPVQRKTDLQLQLKGKRGGGPHTRKEEEEHRACAPSGEGGNTKKECARKKGDSGVTQGKHALTL